VVSGLGGIQWKRNVESYDKQATVLDLKGKPVIRSLLGYVSLSKHYIYFIILEL
jgi:hypothetical protein